jgi:membrane-associated phospholipid phosphatase
MAWAGGLLAGACAVGYAVVARPDSAAVDQELFDVVNRGHGAEADRFFMGVTEFGSLYAAGAAAATLTVIGRRRPAIRALGAAGATWLLLQGMKKVIDRPRPVDADPDGIRQVIARPRASSWPSSHPAVLTAFTRVASREMGSGALARGALSALDLSVATSRVYLGVHYPSDVASGLLIGRAVAHLWPRGRLSS